MSDTKTFVLDIYTETTPNPESIKFVFNRHVVANRSFDFKSAEECERAPIAAKLFELPFVKGVFLAHNFITITKQSDYDWYAIIPELREFLKRYFTAELPIVDEELLDADAQTDLGGTDIEQKIINLLDQYVRPAVEMDGGKIVFKSFDAGVVKLVMQGACSGCPSSMYTLKNGIEGLLKRMVPEVETVEAEEG